MSTEPEDVSDEMVIAGMKEWDEAHKAGARHSLQAWRQPVIRLIRQLLCRHQWRATKFQALGGPTSHECVKCGKMDWGDSDA